MASRIFFPYTTQQNSAGEYGTLNQYFAPRANSYQTVYPVSRFFGNDPKNNTPLEIILDNVLSRVEFLTQEGSATNNAEKLSNVVFEAFDVYGSKLGEVRAYTPQFGHAPIIFSYNPDSPFTNIRSNTGDFLVSSGIKKIRITAPSTINLSIITYLAGSKIDTQKTWKNGVTRTIDPGDPPPDWILKSDGWWYPKDIAAPENPPPEAEEPPPTPPDVQPPTPEAPTVHLTYRIRLISSTVPSTKWNTYKIRLNVAPGKVELPSGIIKRTSILEIVPISLPLRRAFIDEFRTHLSGKIESFFDNDRVMKTLMNFGSDHQIPLINWKPSSDKKSTLLKLYKPLPPELDENSDFFISRELSSPLIDLTYFIDVTKPLRVYLRPANRRVKLTGTYGNIRQNATLETLLNSSSFDIVKPQDIVVEKWFTTALEGAELNVDYSNYRNFVFYSSAQRRLEAFKNKIVELENLNSIISFNSSSLGSLTGSAYITGSPSYAAIYSLSEKRQGIIRSFDPYEQFLYYKENVPFSGTFGDSAFSSIDDKSFDITDVTWPKISGSIAPYASASSWYSNQMDIAFEYDCWNVNRFVNNVPAYIQENADSQEFMIFLDMIGHMFDVVKLYADNMSTIYDRDSNPNIGLSKDLIWNVARSLGMELPNQYALNTLLEYTVGSGSSNTYRDAASETWKRFLHNQIYLLKTKGTKTALRGLLNVYGVLPTTVQIRETVTPSYFYSTQSYEVIEENTNTLNMESGSFVNIPWSSSIGNNPVNLQIRFSTTTTGINQVLLHGDTDWALELIPSTGSYYRVAVTSGSLTTLQSPFFEIGNGDYYNVMVQYSPSSSSLYVKRSDDDGDLIVNSVISETSSLGLSSVWNNPSTLYLGASGTFFGTPFKGEIDEFRIWGETTEERVFDNWTRYPALYNGNTTVSARDSLWVRLSFNIPKNLGGATSLDKTLFNESPYQRSSSAPSNMNGFTSSFFANEPNYPYSFTTQTRTIQRFTPSAGGTQFDTNMIIIEPEPVLKYVTGSSVPVLSRTDSIVSLKDKNDKFTKPNNLIGFYFSPTEAINDSIIKTIGNIDLHDYIGDPQNLYSDSYPLLKELNELYWNYYAYDLNINQFLEFVKDLLNPLFDQAETLTPVRSKLLTGLVIEPHILERNKIKVYPLVKDQNYSFSSSLSITSQPAEISGGIDRTFAVIPITESQVVSATQNDYSVSIESEEIFEFTTIYDDLEDIISISESVSNPSSEYTNYQSQIDIENSLVTLESDYLNYSSIIHFYQDVFTRATLLYNNALQSGTIPYDTLFPPTYGPVSDIETDIGASEYFTDVNGFVGIVDYQRIKTLQSILIDQGTWVQGTIYSKNDYVLYGNKEYYAISDNFISNATPDIDVLNWRPVAYINQEILVIKKAVDISGSISLVSTGSALAPVTGYRSNHYIFNRPTYKAYVDARFNGCVQTDDTTIDGRPVVEIIPSAGDELYVKDQGGRPVSPTSDPAGPILDVR